jgi:hypothetical protein
MISMEWLNERSPELVQLMGVRLDNGNWIRDPEQDQLTIWNLTGRLVDPPCQQ